MVMKKGNKNLYKVPQKLFAIVSFQHFSLHLAASWIHECAWYKMSRTNSHHFHTWKDCCQKLDMQSYERREKHLRI